MIKSIALLIILLYSQFFDFYIAFSLIALCFSLVYFSNHMDFFKFYLASIIVFGPLMGEDVSNIYTIKIVGVPLYIYPIIIYTIKYIFRIRTINRRLVLFYSAFICIALVSIIYYSFIGSLSLWGRISTHMVTVILLFLLYMNRIGYEELKKLFFTSGVSYFIGKILFIILGIGLSVKGYTEEINIVSSLYDPVSAFFLIFGLSMLFGMSQMPKLYIVIYIGLLVLSTLLEGSLGGSSILMLAVALAWMVLIRFKVTLRVAVFLIAIFYIGSFFTFDGLFGEKLVQVQSIFGLLDGFNYTVLPKSPQVRAVEICNVLGSWNVGSLIGSGFGGGITDNICSFRFSQLNLDDYSYQELEQGKYYNLHSPAMLFLEFGLIVPVVLILITTLKIRSVPLIFPVATFVLVNYGFGIKVSIFLAFYIYLLLFFKDMIGKTSYESLRTNLRSAS